MPAPPQLHPLEDVQICELLELPHALGIRLHDFLIVEQHPALRVRADVRDVMSRVDGRALVRDECLETETRGKLRAPANLRCWGRRGGARSCILAGIVGVREEPFDRAFCVVALHAKIVRLACETRHVKRLSFKRPNDGL